MEEEPRGCFPHPLRGPAICPPMGESAEALASTLHLCTNQSSLIKSTAIGGFERQMGMKGPNQRAYFIETISVLGCSLA